MSVQKFLAGFAVGAAIGAVAGILLAPKSGAETREMLGDMASDMAKKTDETVKDIQRKADNLITDAEEKSEDRFRRLGKAVLCVRSGRDGGGAGVEKSRI